LALTGTPTADDFNISNRRYIGGKSLLVKHIFDLVPTSRKRGTFLDVFAGTGVVAEGALGSFDHLILNDLLFSNNTIYQGFFGKGNFSRSKLESFRRMANSTRASKLPTNYFDRHFGGKFFSRSAARMIGFLREQIKDGDFTKREKFILVASLIYSADRIANTVGHYEAYRKKEATFKPFVFRLIKPRRDVSADIFREDSNELVRRVIADVAYVDPPYNSRQYSRFYHVLENLTKWEKPELEGVALKPPLENLSKYCTVNAPEAFEDLIRNLNAKFIIVSYNNTYDSKSTSSQNKITLEEIEIILKSKGRTQIKQLEHKFFNSGKTDFKNHKEYLFITESR